MARIIDANLEFTGLEPKIAGEISQLNLMKALNWYSQNKDTKDSEKYASEYFKKKLKTTITDATYTPTFGFICRMISNGLILSNKDQLWFDEEINRIKNHSLNPVVKDNKNNVVSIQQRINEKISSIAGELDGSIDEYILSKFKKMPSPYSIMQEKVKAVHASRIVDIFKKRRVEFDEVLNTSDEQLVEGYSNFSKSEIKKLVAYCDLIITDAMKLSGETIKSRKPRKRKSKTPDKLVSKLKYCKAFKELKLESLDPIGIIGCSQLWVYNIKKRKLGCYQAEDAGGLSVKGSSIINYSESKSVQKTLRKPEEILTLVLEGGKVFLRNVIGNIKAVETVLSGRFNSDTIILKIIK